MGSLYEILSTPPVYLKRNQLDPVEVKRSTTPIAIPFGSARLQHCVLWEPDEVTHDTVIMYFHGGAYLVGTPESMDEAANVYNSQGYRFCSVGFRLMPHHRFPAQVEDAFHGIEAALAWLEAHGRPAHRIVVGGSSCGGHLATLVGYGRSLQRTYDFPAERLAGIVSVAAITNADDMLVKPIPRPVWRAYIDVPAASTKTDDRHRALAPYSPISLIEKLAVEQESALVPPFFGIHGIADTMSPYAHEQVFVDALNRRFGEGTAQLHTVDDWFWQHMVTTVTLHKYPVAESAPLSALFDWLARVDAGC